MVRGISHDWADEYDMAKAEWFRGLSIIERLAVFNEFFELAIALRPGLLEKHDDRVPSASVQILELSRCEVRRDWRDRCDRPRGTEEHVRS